jgi:uncharacterized membrane protein SirB2
MPGMDILRTLHVGSAVLSITGFLLRGIWMLRASPLLTARLTRILPHIIDTLLLASAIGLALRIHQYPFVHAWLTAKVIALLFYIVLGGIALRYGKSLRTRALAYAGALAVFAYIVGVAVTRQPFPGLAAG